MAILGDQKNAKVIALLEEPRRDSPIHPDRFDAQAASMARPADARTAREAIEETRSVAGLPRRGADAK